MGCFGGRRSFVVISVVALLVGGSAVLAAPVDPARVRQVTEGFLQAKAASRPSSQLTILSSPSPGTSLRPILGDDGTVLAYVIDLEPRGFVALAADTDLAPVDRVFFSKLLSRPRGDKAHPLYRMVREDLRLAGQGPGRAPGAQDARNRPAVGRYIEGRKAARPVGANNHSPLFRAVPAMAAGGQHRDGRLAGDRLGPGAAVQSILPAGHGGRRPVLRGLCRDRDGADPELSPAVQRHVRPERCLHDVQRHADGRRQHALRFPVLHGPQRLLVGQSGPDYAGGVDLNDVEKAALSFACGVAMQMDYSSEGSGASPYDMPGRPGPQIRLLRGPTCSAGCPPSPILVLQENIINRLPAMIGLQSGGRLRRPRRRL